MSSEASVVVESRSQQSVDISVVADDGQTVLNYRLLPGTGTPPVRFDRITLHTQQLAAAGHVTLRSV